ncbi:MAG: DUF2336 domain-containing protein [Phenylobacterium sp.]|uniref:DUF2336 domain-containing protein n=1 Tax=Phenylobacterium sp. TaxID=1871053 RepID=UPI00271A60B1|nr:DUF2336 domain-containing protein [Phenylobacterium sp.]MDO8901478.1 DUF2336 domain-containing protein [Phenylobacterium sp.]MDP2215232.1 DUF2336 domain-containing protein [Phenylobacterium sp.]
MERSKLHDLIALANEPSSARRRELLRGVTDLFFAGDGGHGGSELALFDDVMGQLASDMEEAVRGELSRRLAEASAPPRHLLRDLARDTAISVAEPILTGSSALTDDDLLAVAHTRGQDHLRAISQRPQVSAAVSEAIVERGDDHTIGALLRNDGAELSRETHERVIDRAMANSDLHAAVVSRRTVPVDLLNEMYFVVEAQLRDAIRDRNSEVDPEALEAALAASRKSLATRDGALPDDYEEAERAVRLLKLRNGITPPVLAAFLRNRETTKFLVALCEMADIDFGTARKILERQDLDALSIVCKAAGFERSLYLTFAVLILDREANAMGRAREYGELFEALPREAAQRTIRFWRIRRQTGDVAAA